MVSTNTHVGVVSAAGGTNADLTDRKTQMFKKHTMPTGPGGKKASETSTLNLK